MQSEKISTPIYVECDKMYRSKVCVQEFWYFVSGLDIQIERSENDNPGDAGCELVRIIYGFFCRLTRTYGLVVKVSHR